MVPSLKLIIMKNLFLVAFCVALIASSCDKEVESHDIVQPVLFEFEYINHAWGYKHSGWLIDENGDVKGFNLPEQWIFPDNDGYISKEDLRKNLLNTDTLYFRVDKDKLLDHFRSRFDLLNARMDTSDIFMADAGMSALSVFIWNSDKQKYKKQIIKTKGDIQLTNSNSKTKGVQNWLEDVGEKTDRFYWGF